MRVVRIDQEPIFARWPAAVGFKIQRYPSSHPMRVQVGEASKGFWVEHASPTRRADTSAANSDALRGAFAGSRHKLCVAIFCLRIQKSLLQNIPRVTFISCGCRLATRCADMPRHRQAIPSDRQRKTRSQKQPNHRKRACAWRVRLPSVNRTHRSEITRVREKLASCRSDLNSRLVRSRPPVKTIISRSINAYAGSSEPG
jgi:hypothetical protein